MMSYDVVYIYVAVLPTSSWASIIVLEMAVIVDVIVIFIIYKDYEVHNHGVSLPCNCSLP